jgi:hypothetical protein
MPLIWGTSGDHDVSLSTWRQGLIPDYLFVKLVSLRCSQTLVAFIPEARSIMRNRSPRSFTVETKTGGRQRPIIPHRVAAVVTPRPSVSWPSITEPKTPAPEPRRILPSLIVPELAQAEPEQVSVAHEPPPRPRRGRPSKVKATVAEPAVEQIATSPIAVTSAAPAPAPYVAVPRQPRVPKPQATLPAGERWKRRLGRWAR